MSKSSINFQKYLRLIFLGFTLAIFIYSCKKESTPTVDLNQKIDTSSKSDNMAISDTSSFISVNGESVKGKATVYLGNNKYQLALQDFSANNGPALKVYLSKDANAAGFIDLGPLKSTVGNQVYDIPSAGIVVKDYPYVIIFCKSFNIVFGYSKVAYKTSSN